MNFNEYYSQNFYEKFKDFHKYDAKFFADYLDSMPNLSISKSMHPIIAYNYPEILDKFCRVDDIKNINRSPSITLHYKRNGMNGDVLTENDFEMCEIIKNINNKVYDSKEIEEIMTKHFNSKRQRSIYAKSYPELHDKFESVQDNFNYNMALIALDIQDDEYIIENIEYIKTTLKDKLIESWSKCFYYLDESEYNDDDVLNFIYVPELSKFAKLKNTVYKFWRHHNTTKHSIINSIDELEKCVEMKLDILNIDTDFLNENADIVIKNFPYFYSELNEENKCNKDIQKLALKDPFNVSYIELDDSNVKEFLNCSNTNILESFYGLNDNVENKLVIYNQIEKFEGIFLALQTYPILILILSDYDYYKHVTPYLINHACKMDKNLFSIFKERENKRWK